LTRGQTRGTDVDTHRDVDTGRSRGTDVDTHRDVDIEGGEADEIGRD
jgi:hypothetical protein